jgi:hypothetical protein
MGGLTTLVRKKVCKGRFKNIDQSKFTVQVENYSAISGVAYLASQ